jgi:hypothetical protein
VRFAETFAQRNEDKKANVSEDEQDADDKTE